MEIIKIDLDDFSSDDVEIVAGRIKDGNVVVLQTETVYGFSAIATSQNAIDKIYKIKKRTPQQQKHLISLVRSFCMIRKYCFLSKRQYDYLKKEWSKERALTVILKGRNNNVIKELISEDQGIAVRLPKSEFLLHLIKVLDAPIVSTSLNITGKKELEDISEIDKYFKDVKPDIVVDAGILPKQKPSRLVNLMDMDNIEVIRE
ncbi:MAG: L-threonylcarbamoyladenylate synthase [Candidatus Moraniibacteriota bacterium]|jgi:L-threonylcarbamoyladenylate synthase